MEESKIIGWFSCGVTSAIACKLAIEQYGNDKVELFYNVMYKGLVSKVTEYLVKQLNVYQQMLGYIKQDY